MDDYQPRVFRSYLDKGTEKYETPGRAKSMKHINEVAILKPQVDHVEFHKYSGEHAVILEGQNLWFCHEVRLGEKSNILHIKTPAEKVTGLSIKFNFKPSGKTAGLIVHGEVKVALKSHFAKPIRQTVAVGQVTILCMFNLKMLTFIILQEPFTFSLRQIQLAKQTPTQVIELAFWSAMLEQLPKHADKSTPSKRFSQVTHFLEEAVKVVPLESIVDAIAYSLSHEVALQCANALKASRMKIPMSRLMINALYCACVRMRTGHQIDLNALVATALNSINPSMFRLPNTAIPATVPVRVNIDFTSSIQTKLIANPIIANYLEKQFNNLNKTNAAECEVLSNLSIEHIYPMDTERRHTKYVTTLQSPIEVLKNGRKELASFVEEASDLDTPSCESSQFNNEQMLHLIRDIQERNLKICAELLGAFMEVQISIPLLKSPLDTANTLSSRSNPVAMGVWAMFSMGKRELQAFVQSTSSHSLNLDIADYVTGVLGENLEKPGKSRYAGKLQFLLQGIKRTVSCSSQYVGYSLEHQLCNNLKFDKSISVKKLINDWDIIFKDDALSLVAKSHRPLIARWLKWAVLIHDLREALASYTCVGVIGLTNSGKSKLVKELFGLQVNFFTM